MSGRGSTYHSARISGIREPIHLCTIQPQAIDLCCQIIARGIASYLTTTSYGERAQRVYLLVDDDRHAFVVPDTHPIAEIWVNEHLPWLVGTYAKTADGRMVDLLAEVRREVAS